MNVRLGLRLFLLGLLLFTRLVNAADVPYSDNTSRALTWLQQQQQINGAFDNAQTQSTSWKASAEAAMAYSVSGNLDQINSGLLVQFMNAENSSSTEFLGLRVRINQTLNLDVANDIAEILSRQNDDGGFGSDSGFDSSVYDTAFALGALFHDVAAHRDSINRALEYIQGKQQEDGSFLFSGNNSSVQLSSMTLIELTPYFFQFDLGDSLGKAQQYVLDSLGDNAVLTQMESWQTALSLLAVVPVTTDATRYQQAVNQLIAAQQADGSWGEDVYTTALAIQALVRIQQADTVQDLTKATLTGRVFASGKALENVTVTLAEQNLTATTSVDGRFSLRGVQPGAFSLEYQASGYHAATQSGSVKTGQIFDLGTVQLTPLPNTGIVTGQIKAASDSTPLANVQIHIGGDQNRMAQTDHNGFYRIAVEPGDITLNALLTGYQAVFATATLQAGQEIRFSPQLVVEEISSGSVTLQGNILDDKTGDPVSVSEIIINGGAAVPVAGGAFEILNVSPGVMQITILSSGYHTASVQLNASKGGTVNLGDIRLVPDSEVLDYVIVRGQVLSSEDKSALAGVQIRVAGDTTASTQTDSNGHYRLQVSSGDIVLTASLSGYLTASGAVTAPAGADIVFSPELKPEDTAAQTVTLKGQVIDDQTGTLITNTNLSLDNGALQVVAVDGTFDIPDINVGTIKLLIQADGYHPAETEILATQTGVLDIGSIRLQSSVANEHSTISGRIMDADTQTGIPFASVQLIQIPDPDEIDPEVLEATPTILTVQADAGGYFQINQIEFLYMELFVQSTGYLSHFRNIHFSEYGSKQLNIELNAFSAAGIEITQFATDLPAYPAYTSVAMNATLKNGSDSARRVKASLEILSDSNEQVQQFLIGLGHDQAGTPEPPTLLPNTPVAVQGSWYTGIHKPGQYRAVLSLFDAMNGQVLAQSERHFQIDETRELRESKLLVSPRISRVGANETVQTSVRMQYYGNVEVEYVVNYTLLNPDHDVQMTGSQAIQLKPGDTTVTHTVASTPVTFNVSGEYQVQADVTNEELQIEAERIVVAPSTRLEVNQELMPDTVYPGADKTLKVEILLQGVEQQ